MSNVSSTASPLVRFEGTKGSKEGTCPECKKKGEVGTVCFNCWEDKNYLNGTCPNCGEDGSVGEACPDCGGKFEEVVNEGECVNCKRTGRYGMLCGNCEDQCFLYE
jgi:hypothetical protein